jgi:cobalt-zinc-cadmium efflux system membrane fusion protein
MTPRAVPALTLLLAAAAAPACHGRREPPPQPPEDQVWLSAQALERGHVKVASVSEQEIVEPVQASGRVAFDDQRVTHVFSPVTGRVSRVVTQPGQKVKRGAPLAAILSPDVGSAFSDVVKAEADLVASEREFHRQQKLFEAGAGSRRDFEAAEDNYRKARAEAERTRQKAALLHAGSLDQVTQEYTIRSYIDGEVMARMANPGVEVQGQYSGGQAVELFTVGDIDRVWVLADVAENDLPRVKLGAEAAVRVVAYPDRVFRGRADFIAHVLDPVSRTARVRVELDNKDWALKPEMYAQVFIATAPHRALVVAREAVVRVNDQSFLFVAAGELPDGRKVFERRRVRVADDGAPELATVLEGARSGESVVVAGSVSREQPAGEAWVSPEQLRSGRIQVEEVKERDVEDAVGLGARLAFDDSRVTHVFSPVTGRITRVLSQLGERVRKGAPLLAIVSPDVGSALSDVVKAEADLTAAQHEYERQKELFEARAAAQKDLEAAEDAYRKARAESQRAQQKTRLLHEGTLDKVTQEFVLRSPIDGEIVARNVNPGMEIQGQYSGAASAVELFTIGDLTQLWVLGDVFEMDLPHILEGDPATIRLDAYPDRVFTGKVDWVGDILDPVTRTAKVRCLLPNPDRLLKPEMYQMVNIAVRGQKMVVVPRRAVVRLGGETVVFVQGGERADGQVVFKRRRVVANEEKPGGEVPILDGLRPGEKVVVRGAIFVLGML